MKVFIDGNHAQKAQNKRYYGLGMVSGNNSSRLLLDYKSENPQRYWEILNHIFGEDGIGITYLKLEMGSDINSSSGTEPCVKRFRSEKAEVTRGAGYQLAFDAKKINPNLALDILRWSEPAWVTQSDDIYSARYLWFKQTLDMAFATYNLKFDYVSANTNERDIEPEWIKYLSKSLKLEQKGAYDYSKIKIVSADEEGRWGISELMLKDEELLNAVDIVASHYTSFSDENTKILAKDYGKQIWYNEACSPMSYSKGTHRFDASGSGLCDINGLLDIANRFISMYPLGDMILHSFQPVVCAYYDGVTFSHKQLITANTPWNGFYSLDNGFYMTLHFSQFLKKGWSFIENACFADGKKGGDGHAMVGSKYTYITACDEGCNDYSIILTNTTNEAIVYQFEVQNLGKASSSVDVWETRGPCGGSFDENYFKKISTITPKEVEGKYCFSLEVKPFSLVTISSIIKAEAIYNSPKETENTILPLPYNDDFEYRGYEQNFLPKRGFAPRYTTDQGGAFEVQNIKGNNVLVQQILPETKAIEWGKTPNPTTNFGCDRWFNYQISTDVLFGAKSSSVRNYAGIGLRFSLADLGESGYWIQLFESGEWRLNKNSKTVNSGEIFNFNNKIWANLRIEADKNNIKAYINSVLICDFVDEDAILGGGRASIFSSYNKNCFDNIKIVPLKNPYVERFDNTDENFQYTGDWHHTTMGSFKNYKRTISEGGKGAKLNIKLKGKGFAVTGIASDSAIAIAIDGKVIDGNFTIPNTSFREVMYYNFGLENGEHEVEITVKKGSFSVDALEVVL